MTGFISLTNGRGWTIRYVQHQPGLGPVEGFMQDDTLDKLLERFEEFLDTAICASGD